VKELNSRGKPIKILKEMTPRPEDCYQIDAAAGICHALHVAYLNYKSERTFKTFFKTLESLS